jgi:5-hydroxyisourate hydrolase
MSAITTHVLDTVLGRPAVGIALRLEKRESEAWVGVVVCATDADGRCRELARREAAGTYRLTFDTGAYFRRQSRPSIYPEVSITFSIDGKEPCHLPLLLSENSYTTYRGS